MKYQSFKFFGLLATVLVAGHASAFNSWECLNEKVKWPSNTVNVRYSAVSFANATWRSSMDTAINRVNQNPSNFRFTRSTGDTSVGINNGQTETWFSSNQGILNGAPAIAYNQVDCIDYWIFGKTVEIVESDFVFDVGESYTTSMSKSALWSHGGGSRPFQTTAIHELGHGAGLAHTNNTYNIMGQDWTHIHANGSSARSYLGEDAAHGLVYLYGQRSSGSEDFAVTHFKRVGANGQYSTHGKTRLTNSSGGGLATFTSGGETVFRVNRGQYVRLELTYENNGRTRRTEDVGFYVSTNNIISTYDTRIGGTSKDLGRNTVYTSNNTVRIPSNLTRGRAYWIGAVIDENGNLSEMTESNNATYLPIWVN